MLVKSARLVVRREEGESTLMLGDLRKFMAATEAADADVDVRVQAGVLYDGEPHYVLYAEWVQR